MRSQFIATEDLEVAEEKCPWASVIIDVDGGYHCFESVAEFQSAMIAGESAAVRAKAKPSERDAGLLVCFEINDILSHNFSGYDTDEAGDYLDAYPDLDNDWREYVDLVVVFPTNLI